MYAVGGKVGFYRGDIKVLSEDLKELKPTIMPTVPRILNRLYDKTMQSVNQNYFNKLMFTVAMSGKLAEIKLYVFGDYQ